MSQPTDAPLFALRLTIRNRFIAAFAVVLCVTVALGAFAFVCLSRTDAIAAKLRGEYLPAAHFLGQIVQATDRYRIGEAKMLLAKTPEQQRMAAASLLKYTQAFTKARDGYAPLLHSAEEHRLADVFAQAWVSYRHQSDTLGNLMASGKMRRRI